MKKIKLWAFIILIAIFIIGISIILLNSNFKSGRIIVGTSQGGALGFASDIINSYEIAKSKGLDVEFRYFSPAEAEMALKNNAVDVAYFAPLSAVRANLAGEDITLFGPALYNHYVVLVPPSSNVSSLDDLKGKKLGTLARYSGGYTDFSIIWALKGGSIEKDFKIVEGAPPALAEFLKSGTVDGIIMFEPQATKLVTEGYAKRIISFLDLWKEISGKDSLIMLGFAAHRKWLNSHKEEAKKLLEAYQESFEIIKTHPEVFTPERTKKILGIETEEGIKAIKKKLPPVYPLKWDKEEIAEIEDILKIAVQLNLIDQLPNESIFDILDK